MTTASHDLTIDEAIEAARQSPNFFAAYVMEYEQGALHLTIQDHLFQHDNAYIELPRGHGKTSQMVLRCAWEIGRNPDVRIKYIQQSDRDASKTTALVKHIIESDKYRAVFPGIKPDQDCWGRQDFKVQGTTWQRDSTMEARGIFGRSGGRADILIADDVCDLRNAIQQPTLREQVKEFWYNNWLPMRDSTEGRVPRTWKIGTCYHVDDITADWRGLHFDDGGLLRQPVKGFQSPWPEQITHEYLSEVRAEVGPIAYARAYELTPVTSELIIFAADWIDGNLYDEIPDAEITGEAIASFDFAFTEKKMGGDPDWSVCLIGWRGPTGHLYIMDMLRVRESFPKFARRAMDLCDHHGVASGIAEANGPQAGLVQQLNEMSRFPITPAKRDRDKVTRATERQSFVESGRFHLRRGEGNRHDKRLDALYDEMTTFPASGHDDCVDAAVDLMGFMRTTHGPLQPKRITTDQRDRMSRIYG